MNTKYEEHSPDRLAPIEARGAVPIEDIPVTPQEIVRIRNNGAGHVSVNISSVMLSSLCDGIDMLRRANERLRARLAACERVLNEIIGDGCSPEEGMEVLCERTRQRCWGYFNPSTRASVPKDAAPGDEGKGGVG